uniref:RNA_GG_bind domain-containing protein n=1 Tax=Heterorhabditis bacteriophora TaxID=37862 RepID=A0A1I7XSW7_HETBA
MSYAGGKVVSLDETDTLMGNFLAAENVINDLESGCFAVKDLQTRIEESISKLEELTRAISELSLFSTNEQLEELPTSSLPFMLIPCYLGIAHHNIVAEPEQKTTELIKAKVYYCDFLKRLHNYGILEMEPCCIDKEKEDEESCPKSTKTLTPEQLRQEKIALHRRQRELKDALAEIKRQRERNMEDDSLLRNMYLTQLSYWAVKLNGELLSIEEEIPLLKLMCKRRKEGGDSSSQSERKPRPSSKPFIITRSEQQKNVLGLGYPSIPTMTVDEWYNQRFGANNTSKQLCTDQASSTNAALFAVIYLKSSSAPLCLSDSEHEDDVNSDHVREKKIQWDEYKDEHRRLNQIYFNIRFIGCQFEYIKYSALSELLERMAYRSQRKDSDISDEEDFVTQEIDRSDVDFEPSIKRANSVWSDVVLEQSLEDRSARVKIDRNKTQHVSRGAESYEVPTNLVKDDLQTFKSVFFILCQYFVYKKLNVILVLQVNTILEGWWGPRGRGIMWRGQRGRGAAQGCKRNWMGKAIGEEKAFILFEETRQVESSGGLKVADGSRRRTPGGVFITLFKSDVDVPPNVKDKIFETNKQEMRKIFKAKRKKQNYTNSLMEATDLLKKEKESSVDLKPLSNVADSIEVQEVGKNEESETELCREEMERQAMDFYQKKEEEAFNQKIRWEKWQREHVEAKQRAIEFRAYWDRRHKEDRDLWRDKDFANAIDKMSRAGYKGKHGNFEVPEENKRELDALYMQATVGDYGALIFFHSSDLILLRYNYLYSRRSYLL